MEDIANVDIPEVKVTPEMIEAGVQIFSAFDRRFDGEEETVVAIYQEMRRAQDGVFSMGDMGSIDSRI